MTNPAPTAYRPPAGCYDEMVDAVGETRPHWSGLQAAFADLGVSELLHRRAEAARLLDQDGVVYNAYGDDGRSGQRWRLDPVPTVISSRDWSELETGVIERAELLSLILEDIYGPRTLLERRLLPAELIYAHDGFLRACDGIRLPGAQQLFNYAADIARAADGTPVVVADRTQAPSGSGYALENRTVVSRVLPSLYRDAQVHRLAPFFRSLRLALKDVAPAGVEDPRIVVLTPGPLNETAFEHAVLASSLGYPLVEGRDLSVRGGRVFMRSVGQFEPVDVVLRRVDGLYCDPLELKPDSQLGVPGLVQATRSGAVTVVNTLGSSVLENPALMAYLPRLSEHLMGTPLRLRSVPTWWCGDPEARRFVLEHLPELIIRSTRRGVAASSGWELSEGELSRLRAAITDRPHEWVGQEQVAMGSSPTLTDDGLEPRRSLLRAFAVARSGSYVVMPGGLTRVAPGSDLRRISNQAGAIAKDTWVLSSEPETQTGFWLQGGPAVAAIDPMSSIPARAAENLWWLGRYAERAEAVTRLLRAAQDRRNEFEGSANAPGVTALAVLDIALAQAGALGQPLRALLDNAYAVRDQLSGDTWLVVGPLERALSELDGGEHSRAQAALQEVMRSLLVLSGLGVESMVRDIGWHLLDAGRRLERGLQLLALLRATLTAAHGTATDSFLLESVLTAAESIITYRYRYRSRAQLETVLELLLLDPGNPRSLAFGLQRLTADLEVLPAAAGGRLREEQKLVLAAFTELRVADLSALVRAGDGGDRPALTAFLGGLDERLRAIGAAVEQAHFTHVAPTFALVGPRGANPSIWRAA